VEIEPIVAAERGRGNIQGFCVDVLAVCRIEYLPHLTCEYPTPSLAQATVHTCVVSRP
jgi:hypothetical protein